MSQDWFKDVVEFHKKANQYPEPFIPHNIDTKIKILRRQLIDEEIFELYDAMLSDDIVGVADAIIDSIVVLIGTGIAYGIDIRPVWDEIHKSNMAKFANGLITNGYGKILKPSGWLRPNVEAIIEQLRGINIE